MAAALISTILRYFGSQVEAMRNDRALHLYGVFVAFGHVLTYLNWRAQNVAWQLSDKGESICWPFFESCFEYRIFSRHDVQLILLSYGFASAIGVCLFLARRLCGVAYWWLLFVNVFKTFIYIQDYRLRLNQHYMLYFITFVFLFLPNKRDLLRYTLVVFYFWAAILKCNAEWISGSALYANPLWVPHHLIPASCVYVIILESLIVWGVLCGRGWVYWIALFQLFLFHLVSWPVVGFFYPLLMFALLTIFPLTFFIHDRIAGVRTSTLKPLLTGRQPTASYLFIAVFSLLQVMPMIIPGDERITGEGRLFALHMFDARVFCHGAITLKFKNGIAKKITIPVGQVPRIQCDPAVYFSVGKRKCYELRDDPQFLDLDLCYQARRSHEQAMQPLVDIRNFCQQNLSYNLFTPNEWIMKN